MEGAGLCCSVDPNGTRTMNSQRTFGLVLLIAGVIFLVIGLKSSEAVATTASNGLTDLTLWYLAAAIIGGALALFCPKPLHI